MHILIMVIGYLLTFVIGCLMLLKLGGAIFFIVQGIVVLADKNKWVVLIGCTSLKLFYGRCRLTARESEIYSSIKSEIFEAIVQITTISLFLFGSYKVIMVIVSI